MYFFGFRVIITFGEFLLLTLLLGVIAWGLVRWIIDLIKAVFK